MTTPSCSSPVPLRDLVAYLLGELAPSDEVRVEEHFFGCERCARELEGIQTLRDGAVALVRGGRVTASATVSLVSRAEREGVRVRTYRLAPGEQVACTAAPEDELVVIRLAADLAAVERVNIVVEVTQLASGAREARRIEDVAVDRREGEIVLVYPGEFVRSLPRTRLRCELRAGTPDRERPLGAYVLDHTPWDERPVRG